MKEGTAAGLEVCASFFFGLGYRFLCFGVGFWSFGVSFDFRVKGLGFLGLGLGVGVCKLCRVWWFWRPSD